MNNGHLLIFRKIISFRALRTATLIGNVFTRHKEIFQSIYINTFSIWGRGRVIFSIFQYFCDFLKLKIHENEKTSLLFRSLVYFVINWLCMLHDRVFFDIETIVAHVLVILPGKMAKNRS